MGLSSKLVSDQDMLEWGQNLMQHPKTTFPMKRQQQTQSDELLPLKCPRCDSTNTKFCYYNNYNKTQPRHLCKACKRHWTKGGTLRNVPIGGIRKNKKIKTSNANLDDQAMNNRLMSTIQNKEFSPMDHSDQKGSVSDFFTQPLLCPPPYLDAINNNYNNNGVFHGSNMHTSFSFSSSFASNNNPSSILACFESSIGYDYNGGMNKDSTSTSVIMEMPTSYWCGATIANTSNWDDFETFATSTDLNIPWYDSNVNPS